MSTALKELAEAPRSPPPGVESIDGDWVIPEFANNPHYGSLE
jgi:hypothetical protein